jgi:hypothetical protein
MAERKFGMVEYKRQTGENFDVLRFSLKVPKPRLSEKTRHHLRSAESGCCWRHEPSSASW